MTFCACFGDSENIYHVSFLDFELRFHRKVPCWLIQDFHFCLTSLLSYKFIFSLAKANKFSTLLLLEATQGIPRHDGGSSMVKNKLFLLPKIWARFPLLDSLYYHFQIVKGGCSIFRHDDCDKTPRNTFFLQSEYRTKASMISECRLKNETLIKTPT